MKTVAFAFATAISRQIQTAIRESAIKTANTNLAGSRIDAAAWRGELTNAVILMDGPERNRLGWQGLQGRPDAVQEITIHKDRPFIKVDYLAWFVSVVDISNGGGNYEIYGADQWLRRYVPYPGHYYNRVESNIENIAARDRTMRARSTTRVGSSWDCITRIPALAGEA